ncbi:MAG: hypothetical protein SFV21_06640 [Rhodospirillaceae bacterium]|nr:hypothetical protein [Rhodospirillaceae bacterium]
MIGFDTIGSATLIVYDDHPVLTTDSWISPTAYFGSWGHDYEIPNEQMSAIRSAKYHWFSHGHPDHLNVDSLPRISTGTFLISDHYGGRIVRDLELLGYKTRVLPDRTWIDLSANVRVYSIANYNQDSILLVDVMETLIIDANDSPDLGASFEVRRLIKDRKFRTVFYCALHGWGGADMLNLFDPSGNKLVDVEARRRPIAPGAQRMARKYGATHIIPFSGFHRYVRKDSVWANRLIPELSDYQTDQNPNLPPVLPAFVRVDARTGGITPIKPPRSPPVEFSPEEFGDNWSDCLEKDDLAKVDSYFRDRQHIADRFGFIEVIVGGRSHTVSLNPGRRSIGISFEAPRHSFMSCIEHEIFDDLLIGNYMKTTLHGLESLYPDFSPYVAKYADNGGAKTKSQLYGYFGHYFMRSPIASTLRYLTTNTERVFRKVCAEDTTLFKAAKALYYRMK